MEEKIKQIILGVMQDAAFMGYDKDDEMSAETFNEIASDAVKKILKEVGK